MRRLRVEGPESLEELICLYKKETNRHMRQRLQVLVLVKEGRSAPQVAKLLKIHAGTVRRYVDQYNQGGIEGLRPHFRGRSRKMTREQEKQFQQRVYAGAQPEDEVNILHGLDLQRILADEIGVNYSLSAVYVILHRLRCSCLCPRPSHPKGDPEQQEAFKNEGFPQAMHTAKSRHPECRIEIWHQDEMRTGQQGTLTCQWAETGTRLCVPKQTEYEFVYLFGATCFETGNAVGLVLPEANTAMMNLFLQEMAQTIDPDVHALLVLDQAAWHQSKSLVVPEPISLVPLPPYSPELNPIERVWNYLRSHYLANAIYKNYEAIVDAVSSAWNRFRQNVERVKTVTNAPWLCTQS